MTSSPLGAAGRSEPVPTQPTSGPALPDSPADDTGRALLLVLLDIDSSVDEDEFNRWYFEEHIRERLACPGFISARRFVAVHSHPRYLALYEIDSPDALATPEYQELARSPAIGNSVERPSGSPRTFSMLRAFRNPTRNVYREIQPLADGGQASRPLKQASQERATPSGPRLLPPESRV
jgi:hypothetical protein